MFSFSLKLSLFIPYPCNFSVSYPLYLKHDYLVNYALSLKPLAGSHEGRDGRGRSKQKHYVSLIFCFLISISLTFCILISIVALFLIFLSPNVIIKTVTKHTTLERNLCQQSVSMRLSTNATYFYKFLARILFLKACLACKFS